MSRDVRNMTQYELSRDLEIKTEAALYVVEAMEEIKKVRADKGDDAALMYAAMLGFAQGAWWTEGRRLSKGR